MADAQQLALMQENAQSAMLLPPGEAWGHMALGGYGVPHAECAAPDADSAGLAEASMMANSNGSAREPLCQRHGLQEEPAAQRGAGPHEAQRTLVGAALPLPSCRRKRPAPILCKKAACCGRGPFALEGRASASGPSCDMKAREGCCWPLRVRVQPARRRLTTWRADAGRARAQRRACHRRPS